MKQEYIEWKRDRPKDFKVVLLRPAMVWVEEVHVVEARTLAEAIDETIKKSLDVSFQDVKNGAIEAKYIFPKKVTLNDLMSEKAFIGSRRAEFVFDSSEEIREKLKLSLTDIDKKYIIVDESKSKLI